jgi:hypothetical protein
VFLKTLATNAAYSPPHMDRENPVRRRQEFLDATAVFKIPAR